jgi:hypothetical protein
MAESAEHYFFFTALLHDPETGAARSQHHGTLCLNEYDPPTCVEVAVEQLAATFKCAPKDIMLTALNPLPNS